MQTLRWQPDPKLNYIYKARKSQKTKFLFLELENSKKKNPKELVKKTRRFRRKNN